MAKGKPKIAYMLEDNKVKIGFSPDINPKNFNDYMQILTSGTVGAYTNLVSRLSMMRAPTQEEFDMGVYVFRTDDENDKEHQVYLKRRELYDFLKRTYDSMLSELFPDIIYIEGCKERQLNKTFEEGYDHEQHMLDINEITKQVRENYDEIISVQVAEGLHYEEEARSRDKDLS